MGSHANLVSILLMLLLTTANLAQSAQQKITPAETTELLRAAVEAENPKALQLRGFSFEPPYKLPDKYYPRFHIYEAIWDPPEGSVNIGFYALDPLTLDVWNGVVCKEIKSPKLERIQRAIRTRIGLTDSEYKKLRVTGPEC